MTIPSLPAPLLVSLLAIRLLVSSAVPISAEDQNADGAALASYERAAVGAGTLLDLNTYQPFAYLSADRGDVGENNQAFRGKP